MDLQSMKTLQYPLRRGKHHELSMPRAKAWLYSTVATRRFRNDVLLSYLKTFRPPRAPFVFAQQIRAVPTDLVNKFAYLPKLSNINKQHETKRWYAVRSFGPPLK